MSNPTPTPTPALGALPEEIRAALLAVVTCVEMTRQRALYGKGRAALTTLTAALSQGAADAARLAGRERDAAFDVARVAHWLLNDPGYTKRHAARALADIARGLHREAAEQALGDAARAGEASHG